ncbi:putative glutamate carboxypeptidase [Aureobasidium subglaciale]|nr:putative glutamate carboxypeptidase [Aureobasidium subglaciale]
MASNDERTPLIQVVAVRPHRDRYGNHTAKTSAKTAQLRRFCTIALVVLPLTTIALAFLSFAFGQSDLFGDDNQGHLVPWKSLSGPTKPPHSQWPAGNGLSFSDLKDILSSTPDPKKAKEWSQYYTAGAHLAGQNLSQAVWTKDRWEEFGVKSEVVPYEVYINYPLDHRLALLKDGEVSFEATLEEDVLEEDPTSGDEDRVPVFHGYSASGNVTAQYVYCNYGTFMDFENLLAAGIELEGKIALVRYGGIFRGLKVKRAQELGMVGTIIYTDPGDDGLVTEVNGYKPYPEGPARNPSSVQRGSVQYLSQFPGDPTTPGYASKPGVVRQPANASTPSIPSLPLSYAEAIPLLQALNGHGPNASSFPNRWHKGGLEHKNVSYNIGPSPPSVTVNLMNLQNYTITPLWNTIGIINGSLTDEVIVIGNHRDAWIKGGAGDPNSGSAALIEVIRSFGVALSKGWKPQRTIVFASWDGEEYGLVGSTEWVEDYLPWLKDSAVAYLNVDVGTRGTRFNANAAPLLNQAIYEVTKSVKSPNQTVEGATVYDQWDKHIGTMGSGSDFTAFQDFAGIPSADFGFGKTGPLDPVYHYHSNYDSFAWMERYGDPTFQYHVAAAKVWALLTASLSERAVVPFNASDYATSLERYLDSVKRMAEASDMAHEEKTAPFKHLDKAIGHLQHAAKSFDARAAGLAAQASAAEGTYNPAATKKLFAKIRAVNTQYKVLERAFLYPKGLDGRSWFKHVVFAPGKWTGYAGDTFPGLVEAIQAGDKKALHRWAGIIEGIVWKAAGVLS